MDSDLEQRLNRGLIVEQRGLEEGGWRRGLGDKLCAPPHPLHSLYRWPGGPWGEIRGMGCPTWTPKPPKPSHTFPPETCHIWVLVFPPGGGFPPLGAPPPPWTARAA